MKAVLICGSPRKNGSTAKILGEITKGLIESGFEISQHFIGDLNISYCLGCLNCEESGVCVQNDDVDMVIHDIASAQLVIVASPSYWGDVTGQLKVFIDRCTPYCNTHHPARTHKSTETKGVAIAIRAGGNKAENENLVHTIEHFLGHLDIPLTSSFTVERIKTLDDLESMPQVLEDAYNFSKSLAAETAI